MSSKGLETFWVRFHDLEMCFETFQVMFHDLEMPFEMFQVRFATIATCFGPGKVVCYCM